jgi:hypothetical protein
MGDADIRLHPSDRELIACLLIFWQTVDSCHCVVFKTGERNYRSQFCYEPYKQMGIGTTEYDDLSECLVATLQARSDYAAERQGDLPEKRR